MSDAQRRAAVRGYVETVLKGDRDLFKQRTGFSKGRVTQILREDSVEPFGERAAINLAKRLRLPDDYFLGRPALSPARSPALNAEFKALFALWEPLFAEQKEALYKFARAENEKARSVIREMRTRGLLKEDVPEDVLPSDFTRPAQRDLIGAAPGGRGKRKKGGD